MSDFKSKGIVFRSVKYSETSLILEVFTKEKGMRSFIVSGVRSSKAKNKASLYQHLNLIDIVAYDKEDKLARIKECRIDYYYQNLSFDVVRSSIGLFMLEICKNTIKEKEENVELFDFIYNWLLLLDSDNLKNIGLLPIKFMLELSQYLGFKPLNNFDESKPYFDLYNGKFISGSAEKHISSLDVSAALAKIDSSTINDLESISYPKSIRNRVIDDLVIYYKLHMDLFKDLKTLEVLRAIF